MERRTTRYFTFVCMLFLLAHASLFAQSNAFTIATKEEFQSMCELYNCDAERVEGRIVIEGFFAPDSTNALFYLNFDEEDGQFKDHSVNGNHPDVFDRVYYNDAGKFGGCLSLVNALASVMEVPASAAFSSLQGSVFTLNFWVKAKSKISAMSSYVNFFQWDDGLAIMGYGSSDKISFRYQNTTRGVWDEFLISEESALTPGEWNNVWIIRDGDTLDLYIDGIHHHNNVEALESDAFSEKLLFGAWHAHNSYKCADVFIDDFYISDKKETTIQREKGVITMNTIDTKGESINFVTVSLGNLRNDTNSGRVNLYAATDGGSNWVTLTNETLAVMPMTGQSAYDKLRVKIELESFSGYEAGTAIPSDIYSPELGSFTVSYMGPKASLKNKEYVKEGDIAFIKVAFPFAIENHLSTTNRVAMRGSTNFVDVTLQDFQRTDSNTVATFSLYIDDTFEPGLYDLFVDGFEYVDYAGSVSATFNGLFLVNGSDAARTLVESEVRWFPSMVDLSQGDAGFHSASIIFVNTTGAETTIRIYDEMGRYVRTVAERDVREGICEYVWDAKNDFGATVRTGFYFAKVTVGTKTSVARVYVER